MPASDRAAAGRGAWLALFAALSAAPAARFADVQLMEVAQFLVLAAAAAVAIHARVRIRFAPVWLEFARPYGFLLAACAAVSLLAMRLPFYPPPDISALKQPLVLSVARLAEMFLSMFGLLLAAAALRRSRNARRTTLDVFTGVAALSAAVSILAWILLKGAGLATPFVYDFNDRVRGFFNEAALTACSWLPRRWPCWCENGFNRTPCGSRRRRFWSCTAPPCCSADRKRESWPPRRSLFWGSSSREPGARKPPCWLPRFPSAAF